MLLARVADGLLGGLLGERNAIGKAEFRELFLEIYLVLLFWDVQADRNCARCAKR
jgi:hypothetical protein